MAKKYYERRSLTTALKTYLVSLGWNIATKEGWQSDDEIAVDTVAVYFLPSVISELQMGRGSNEKGYVRRIQIDCYMANENRADAIAEDVLEFVDLQPVVVKDQDANSIANMICYDTGSISSELVPPNMSNPKLIRWRGVVKATYETHYF